MSCCNSEVAVTAGCLNGTTSILIHTEHIRNESGEIIGVDMHYTLPNGIKVVPGPSDQVTSGACPVSSDGGPDHELSWYYNPADGLACRKVVLLWDTVSGTLQAFEAEGGPVADFDAQFLRDKCPCPQRVPSVPW